jgi:glycosyltransferase involved in cell wall biosynthesis
LDLAHGPGFVGPLLTTIPFVVTIHDLSFVRFPQLFRPANRLYLTILTRASVRRASRIIAVSRHAADETVQLLGANPDKVDVVYHGVDPVFRVRSEEEIAAFRARRGLPHRFLLYVGTLEPRKNLSRLVEAYAQLQEPGFKLVLGGGKGWYYEEILRRVTELGLEEVVVFPGFIPAEELPLWYNAATALVYPSLYEGFGMPVLEGMASATPVITSNCSSLPEAAGGGALLVDPLDVEALAAGLRQLMQDRELCQRLVELGLEHARRFNWPKTARDTWVTYQKAIAKEPSS